MPDGDAASNFSWQLARAKGGSFGGFRELVESHRSRLEDLSRKLMPAGRAVRGTSGSDLLQESMLRAWHGIGRFKATDRTSFWKWLRSIVVRQAASVHRTVAAKREVSVDSPPDERESTEMEGLARLIRDDDRSLAWRLLAAVKDDTARGMVVARFFDAASPTIEEAGATFGLDAAQSRARWVAAMRQMDKSAKALGGVW